MIADKNKVQPECRHDNGICVDNALKLNMLEALCADFSDVYRVDCKTRAVEILRYTGNAAGIREIIEKSSDPYRSAMEAYIYNNVFAEDRAKLNSSIDFDNIYERLKRVRQFHLHYRVLRGNQMHYYCMKCCREESGEDFGHVILSFANEDADKGGDNIIERVSPSGIGERRKVLIVEDVELNREILNNIVKNDYDVLTAENGADGLKLLADNYRDLSVVLLDMHMPVMDGFEFLKKSRTDALLSTVPVIVTTGSNNSDDEVRCLELGASDFITKPYNPRVVLSRIKSIIKLHESDITLAAVEYDDMTGLYTRPAFYHYAENLVNASGDSKLDIIVSEIENLTQIEASFGEHTGEEILAYFGRQYAKNAPDAIGFRRGNQFIFIMKRETQGFKDWLRIGRAIEADAPISNIIVKYGFYFDADKSISLSEMCDRARLTVDSIRGSFLTDHAMYDEKIVRREKDKFRMEADFDDALKNEEFVIYQQPKYDVNGERIVASEALVRWKKPDGSMISPGAFIPLFESDGLIIKLDEYVFRKVCAIQKERIDRGEKVVRVSINLSRATLVSDGVVDKYAAIVKEIGIPFDIISIELTESFALENNHMTELAQSLVNAGFRLDMDDFGSGYSSMSSLVTLPFRIVKLDKTLIDRIGDRKGEIIIEYAIIIAHKLDMGVVAEGVEHAGQAEFLKSAGCDMIQGFYYSPPVPTERFSEMLREPIAASVRTYVI